MPLKYELNSATFVSTIVPSSENRKKIDIGVNADLSGCWTCGSCDFECPVNIATGRLRPQTIVRLANLGQLDELLCLPGIWYCLSCRRCRQICPNTVKPSELIAFIRQKAVEEKIISVKALHAYKMLFTRFQRIRYHAVSACLKKDQKTISDHQWYQWLQSSISHTNKAIKTTRLVENPYAQPLIKEFSQADVCFTCGECSSACPLSCGRYVFDPRTIFRMVRLGLIEELMCLPSIWLCIDCGRCTEACSQLVDGRQLIRSLKKMAIERKFVDGSFVQRLEFANRLVYGRWLDEVDAILGLNQVRAGYDGIGADNLSAGCLEYTEAFVSLKSRQRQFLH